MGKVGKALEVASGVIGVANALGIPTESVFGQFFEDETATALAEISASIAELQASVDQGFATTNTNNFLRQIAEASAPSKLAATTLLNTQTSSLQKQVALEQASTGLNNVINASNSILGSQEGAFTPEVITKLYEALSNSLAVMINVSTTWASGVKVGSEYLHGGTMAYKADIDAGVTALLNIQEQVQGAFAVASDRADLVGPYGVGYARQSTNFFDLTEQGLIYFYMDHKFESPEIARTFFQELLSEVLPVSDQDFGDERLIVTEDDAKYFFPQPIQVPIVPAIFQIGGASIRERALVEEIGRAYHDKVFNYLTGEKVARDPASVATYSWNDPTSGAFDINALLQPAKDNIAGEVITASDPTGGNITGTEDGDFLNGISGNDRINGLGGDDYLFGNDGNDFMFGGEGNDHYFGAEGSDGYLDSGSESDVDVGIFEGNFNDYNFFREVGEQVRVLVVEKEGTLVVLDAKEGLTTVVFDTDVTRGIEIFKFDDVMVRVSDIPLLDVDKTPPAPPVILAFSDDNGFSPTDSITSDGTLILNGTAEANSSVIVEMTVQFSDIGSALGTVKADETGAWEFDYSGTDIDDGRYDFTAYAVDAAGNGSNRSTPLGILIDKTAPTLFAASLASSGAVADVAAAGDTITLLFTPNEFLPGLPAVTIAGLSAIVTNLGVSELLVSHKFSATVTLDKTAVAGLANFTVDMIDYAENQGTGSAATDGSTITIDVPVINPFNKIDGDGGNNSLLGTAGADQIRGFDGNDELRGLGGGDILKGGKGADTLISGSGSDTVEGGNGSDLIFGGKGADDIKGGKGGDNIKGGDGGDTIKGGGGADTINGGNGADLIEGGVGNDKLFGGSRADKLDGGFGKDVLSGNKGSDVFVFDDGDSKNTTSKRDVITDFERGRDSIDLRLTDANKGIRGDQSFDFNGNSAQENSVWFKVFSDGVIVNGDNSGDGIADFKITLLNVSTLTADDFFL